jgi:thioredoxin reductase
MAVECTEVAIVGAGPVGLTLALDLGRRGVKCVLVERNEQASRLPKMERCNGRTMERPIASTRQFASASRSRWMACNAASAGEAATLATP